MPILTKSRDCNQSTSISVVARIAVKYSLHLIVASIDQSLVTTVFHRTFAMLLEMA